MDWKEILRRRLATPSTSPHSEFGRSRLLRDPGPKHRELGGRWMGRSSTFGKTSRQKRLTGRWLSDPEGFDLHFSGKGFAGMKSYLETHLLGPNLDL